MAEATNDNGRRRKRVLSGEERPTHKGRKLKQYVLEEKLDIIDYAKVIGNRAAGREFNVAESSIREWRKNEQRLRAMFETAERSRIDSTRRRPISEDLEKTLLLYIASQSEVPLTWNAIKEKANDIWNKICEKETDIKGRNFTANMGWVARFIKRNNIQITLPNDILAATGAEASCCRNSLISPSATVEPQLDNNRIVEAATSLKTTESVAEQVPSKRKRKNFIPRKMVEKNCVLASNILLETLADKHFDPGSIPGSCIDELETKDIVDTVAVATAAAAAAANDDEDDDDDADDVEDDDDAVDDDTAAADAADAAAAAAAADVDVDVDANAAATVNSDATVSEGVIEATNTDACF